jgi:hypothetical protein
MNSAELDKALTPSPPHDYGTIPTGSVGLDVLLGGGWPVQGVSEIYGHPTSGRSTLLYYAIAAAQKRGLDPVGLIDGAKQFNLEYAEDIGVDLSSLILAASTELVSSLADICPLLVIDELASTDLPYGLYAPQATVIYTLQMRTDLNSGRNIVSGHHLAPCTRVKLRASFEGHGNLHTQRTSVIAEVVKSRQIPQPANRGEIGGCHFEISAAGIDQEQEILLMSSARNLVERRGNWYYLDGKPMGGHPGWVSASAWLRDNPYERMYLEDRLRSERS